MKFSKIGKWQYHWGPTPLPLGAEPLGTITGGNSGTGALLRLFSGEYVQGNAGMTQGLDQGIVEALISASAAASALGSIKTPAKATASRKNGGKGGRPRKRAALIGAVMVSSCKPFILYSLGRGVVSEHWTLSAARKAAGRDRGACRRQGCDSDAVAYSYMVESGWTEATE